MKRDVTLDEMIARESPEAQARIAKEAARLIEEELTLRQLREAQHQSQEEVAATLGIKQPSVAKLERRTDVYVRTLRKYVEALGGELEITAKFPGRKPVHITQFAEE